jgi:phosphomannomutase
MLQGDVLIGGEESGGIGVAGHIPERDGIANSLLLLEAVVTSGKPLAELFAELERETEWVHAYDRRDLKLNERVREALTAALASPPPTFAGRAVESVETLDGIKLNLSGHAWVLFRVSGTEPVLRLYCEAPSPEDVKGLLAAAQRYVEALG